MLDYADVFGVNKFDKAGALDALHDVRKTIQRNHGLWDAKDDQLPVVGTIASQFNDDGVNELFERLMEKLASKTGVTFKGAITHHAHTTDTSNQSTIIPPSRVRYLSEIAETVKAYDLQVEEQQLLPKIIPGSWSDQYPVGVFYDSPLSAAQAPCGYNKYNNSGTA